MPETFLGANFGNYEAFVIYYSLLKERFLSQFSFALSRQVFELP